MAADDLEDFFREIGRVMMVDGEATVAMLWVGLGDVSGLGLPQFVFADRSTLRRKSLRSGYTLSVPKEFPGSAVETCDVSEQDVFRFTWPLPGVSLSGVSPVDRVLDLHVRESELMGLQLAIQRSGVATEDNSLRTERARWMSARKVNDEISRNDLEISGELFRWPLMPGSRMTKYFEVYHFLDRCKREAIVREHIVECFNRILGRFAAVVVSDEDQPALRLVGYPALSQIEDVIEAFQRKELNGHDAVKLAKPLQSNDS